MNFNLNNFGGTLLTDAKVNAKFVIDTEKYEIENFKINFNQAVDHKGQPQHEVKGGHFDLVFSQTVSDNLYDWAKRDNKRKSGKVIFYNDEVGTIFELVFKNANCIRLQHNINVYSGTTTSMIISPEIVVLQGIEHDKQWKE